MPTGDTFDLAPALALGSRLNLPAPASQQPGAGPLSLDEFYKSQQVIQGEKQLTQAAVDKIQKTVQLAQNAVGLNLRKQELDLAREKFMSEKTKELANMVTNIYAGDTNSRIEQSKQNALNTHGLDATREGQAKMISERNEIQREYQEKMYNVLQQYENSDKGTGAYNSTVAEIGKLRVEMQRKLDTPEYTRAVAYNRLYDETRKGIVKASSEEGNMVDVEALRTLEQTMNIVDSNPNVDFGVDAFIPSKYVINEGDIKERLNEYTTQAMGTQEIAELRKMNIFDEEGNVIGTSQPTKVTELVRNSREKSEAALRTFVESDARVKSYLENYYATGVDGWIADQMETQYTKYRGEKIVKDFELKVGETAITGTTDSSGVPNFYQTLFPGLEFSKLSSADSKNLIAGVDRMRKDGYSVEEIRQVPMTDIMVIGEGEKVNFITPPYTGGRPVYDIWTQDPSLAGKEEDNDPKLRRIDPKIMGKRPNTPEEKATPEERSKATNDNVKEGVITPGYSNVEGVTQMVDPKSNVIKYESGGGEYQVNPNDEGKPSLGYYQFNGELWGDFVDFLIEKNPDAAGYLEGVKANYDYTKPLTEEESKELDKQLKDIETASGGTLTQQEYLNASTEFWKERKIKPAEERIRNIYGDEKSQLGIGGLADIFQHSNAGQTVLYSILNQHEGWENIMQGANQRYIEGVGKEITTPDQMIQYLEILQDERTNYLRDYYSDDFGGTDYNARLQEVADNVGIDADVLNNIIIFESAGDPKAKNPNGTATGLIQFVEATAENLGTSTEELSKMSALEQLDYVERYFQTNGVDNSKITDGVEGYLSVFYPGAVGKKDSYVIGSEVSEEKAKEIAAANPSFSRLPSGKNKTKITKGDVRKVIGPKFEAIKENPAPFVKSPAVRIPYNRYNPEIQQAKNLINLNKKLQIPYDAGITSVQRYEDQVVIKYTKTGISEQTRVIPADQAETVFKENGIDINNYEIQKTPEEAVEPAKLPSGYDYIIQ